MLSEVFWIVISGKIVDSSVKFKFFHKIFVTQKNFIQLFDLICGPDITRSGAGPRAVHPWNIRTGIEKRR